MFPQQEFSLSLHLRYFSLVLYAKDYFISWYKPFSNHLYYIEKLGIDKGEFRSWQCKLTVGFNRAEVPLVTYIVRLFFLP